MDRSRDSPGQSMRSPRTPMMSLADALEEEHLELHKSSSATEKPRDSLDSPVQSARPMISLADALDEEHLEIHRSAVNSRGSVGQSVRNSQAPALTSLADALDEEHFEIMNSLEASPRTSGSPVRSMLDISSGPVPRHGSIAGIGVGITDGANASGSPAVGSMINSASATGLPQSASKPTSPTSSASLQLPLRDRQRSSSDATRRGPAQAVPSGRQDLSTLPSIASQTMSKRPSQSMKKAKDGEKPTAMASALSGDFSSLGFGRRREGRHNSTAGITAKSRSPSSRLPPSSKAPIPGPSILKTRTSTSTPSDQYVGNKAKLLNTDKAQRKLSSRSGDSFSTAGSGETDGMGRVHKDPVVGEDEGAIESSEEEESSSDDEVSSEAGRGRRRSRRKKGIAGSETDLDENDGNSESTIIRGEAEGVREAEGLLAAAEQRKKHQSMYPSQSSVEPEVSIIGPSGERLSSKNEEVHPSTNYDAPVSGRSSAASSDYDGEISDIKRAQKLSINVSGVEFCGNERVSRIILRGDFAGMQEEAEEGRRRQRTYLVATDLSENAVYALEWTIGTILRDGDTLLAIYAIDQEEVGSKGSEVEKDNVQMTAEGMKAAEDAMTAMDAQTEKTLKKPTVLTQSGFMPATEATSLTGSMDSRIVSKAQQDRLHAVDQITNTCLKFLRKTRLQVRVSIEVLHCKSPRHVITEAIDTVEPTLVVLGSRGRSALKGVLLGSFSNYLVTKSSVPVMVARKKLKKHSTNKKSSQPRLANNLTTPGTPTTRRSLVNAKID